MVIALPILALVALTLDALGIVFNVPLLEPDTVPIHVPL